MRAVEREWTHNGNETAYLQIHYNTCTDTPIKQLRDTTTKNLKFKMEAGQNVTERRQMQIKLHVQREASEPRSLQHALFTLCFWMLAFSFCARLCCEPRSGPARWHNLSADQKMGGSDVTQDLGDLASMFIHTHTADFFLERCVHDTEILAVLPHLPFSLPPPFFPHFSAPPSKSVPLLGGVQFLPHFFLPPCHPITSVLPTSHLPPPPLPLYLRLLFFYSKLNLSLWKK